MYRELWLSGHRVELPEMLSGREKRAQRQREFLSKGGEDCALVSFTVNMAGPVKVCAASEIVFNAGLTEINDAVKDQEVLFKRVFYETYGHEAFWLLRKQGLEIKKTLTEIEETHPLGRLFDIDVICSEGNKISREDLGLTPRKCLICGGSAADCAGGRIHSVSHIQDKVLSLVINYEKLINRKDKALASGLAYSAMIAEVNTTPKPGLVDRRNNGSHKDMCPEAFEASAMAIKDYFARCFEAGDLGKDLEDPVLLLPELRRLGLDAEERMYFATGGVNTHKGLIFCLGFICAALGGSTGAGLDNLFYQAAATAAPTALEASAAGEKNVGARAQVASGYPQLRFVAIPSFLRGIKQGLDINRSGVYTLLKLIAEVNDTNMIKRGGADLARKVRLSAEEASKKRPEDLLSAAESLDDEFIKNNLSPGGCADILALTYFIMMLTDIGMII